ncbi:MAG TPA: thioesterase [Micromonosporaceae bacterium]|nr:thioesterase [Micromonosporaceae bacterium]HCU52522.1 thioesterase [Micromonosporaceae bacterium]
MTTRAAIRRSVDWQDTDAAGHYHHSTVVRWAEAAEAALLEELGLIGLFGTIPRVRYEANYLSRLWFRDVVDIGIRIGEVGRTSVTYVFEVRRGDTVAVHGRMVMVNAPDPSRGATPWPQDVRDRLSV